MVAEVLNLRDFTLRDVPSVLRKIAEQIESGDFGSVQRCAVVVMNEDDIDICLSGDAHSLGDAHILLHAGMIKLADSL